MRLGEIQGVEYIERLDACEPVEEPAAPLEEVIEA